MIPKRFFLTKGVGVDREELTSRELALREAQIETYNLVKVSSILPPDCRRVSRKRGLEFLKPGQIVYYVISENKTNEPNRLISSAIGVAVPTNKKKYGYLSEHHAFGETAKKSGEYAEDLAATMLSTTLGIEFDLETAWDERKQIYRASGKIISTTNVCQSAEGNKEGMWTTVVAAAVFII